jgi:hypothetical protein
MRRQEHIQEKKISMDCMREKAGYIDWLEGLKAVFPASRVLVVGQKEAFF